MTLTSSRKGINATVNDIKQLGELLLPLLKKGQSIYSILQSHKEIKLSEKTIYNYIENGVFQECGRINQHNRFETCRKTKDVQTKAQYI